MTGIRKSWPRRFVSPLFGPIGVLLLPFLVVGAIGLAFGGKEVVDQWRFRRVAVHARGVVVGHERAAGSRGAGSYHPLVRYAIPALHSLQYLYFVWLMRRNEARAAEGPPTFGTPTGLRLLVLALTSLVLGWLFFHAPEHVDGWLRFDETGTLGPTPILAAVFVFVNVHHYLMDSVIWRRENPATRWLHAR